jgi:hypothetical protein
MPTLIRPGERGAILIQTAVAFLGLLAFCALAIDYGVLWVARGQAQNAADAGALAGAVELAFGDADDINHIKAVAIAAAKANKVFNADPVVDPPDVTIGPCPPGSPGPPDTCIRVEVFRNQVRGNPLPRFFLPLVGVAEHGIRATATAQVATGAKTTCLKPWVVPDKWADLLDTTTPIDSEWTIDDTFDRYNRPNQNPNSWTLLGDPKDFYTPPTEGDPGTGYTVPNDVGKLVTLKADHWKQGVIGPGNMQTLDLPNPNCGGGANLVTCNIASCNPSAYGVGDFVWTEPGGMGMPQKMALDDWLQGDTAVWECADGSDPAGRDCVGAPSTPGTKRLVPIAAIDIQDYLDRAFAGEQDTNGKIQVRISRLLGFFIEQYDADEITGRFAYYPSTGELGGNVDETANFLRTIILVR